MNNKLIRLMERIADRRIKEFQPIRREPVRVVSVGEGSLRARVRFLNGSELTLLNKTGEKLTAGDQAWVEYQSIPSSGYIAMRNGEADPLGGSGASGLLLTNGIVVSPSQSAAYAKASVQTQQIAVNNLERLYYSQTNNPIVVGGALVSKRMDTPIMPDESTKTYDYSAYSDVMTSVLRLGGDTFSTGLISSTSSDAEYGAYMNGVMLPYAYVGGSRYNRCSFRAPERYSYDIVLIPTYGTIYGPDEDHPYGSVGITVRMIPVVDGYKVVDTYTYSGEIHSGAKPRTDENPISRQAFGSMAEYEYAIGVTGQTSLPPSL